MKFSDIIALAKAGYTPADIREFMSQETGKDSDHTPDDAPAEKAPEEKKDPDPDTPDTGNDIHKDPEEKVNYEEKYKELEKQFSNLQKSLKEAQLSNTKQDASGGKKEDPQDIFSAAAAAFM